MRVCILGGNLSGLTLAKALVNQKIYVDLLHTKKMYQINKTRTIGISKKNIEFLNKNIIDLKKIFWKLKKIEIFSDNLGNEKLLNFENNNEYLFSIAKNFKFQEILKKSLVKNKYFKKLKINKKISYENYNLVINTDYSNLITRKYFSKKIEKKYSGFAYTTIIRHEKILNNVARQIFTQKGPLAFLPVSNSETSVVYSASEPLDGDKYIKNLILKYNYKYKIKKIYKIESFNLKALNLRKYFQNNILAFGNLLHTVHPLAGQGFNMIIRDIIILVKIIEEKINLGLPLDKSVCSEFEKKTRHKNFIFSKGIDLVHEFFNLERKTNSKVLGKSIKIFGENSSINKIFTTIADEGFVRF